ncbi:MAG: hypothetical protein ACTSYY_08120 [Promethearchaeota archaeon]
MSFAIQPIDDEYEENDSFSEARLVHAGLYKNLCQADEDWYKISIAANDYVPELYVKLSSDMNNFQLNLTLYDLGGNILKNGTNQTGFPVIQHPIFNSNTYFLQVNGPNNGNLYDMEIIIREHEDGCEQNDNIENAWNVGSGKFSRLSQYDDDWFVLHSLTDYIHKNDYIRIDMTYNTDEYLEIEFTNENYTPYNYQLKERSWGKRIEWTAEEDNVSLYIHVYGNSTGVSYGLDISKNEKSIPGYRIEAILLLFVISAVKIAHHAKRKKNMDR